MTAPDLPTWTVADDADGEPTLWYGDIAMLNRYDLDVAAWGVGTPDTQRQRDALLDQLWSVLTEVLAPEEATVDRLALAHCPDPAWHLQGCPVWAQRGLSDRDPCNCHRSRTVRAILAALAGTSAQARHTDGDAAGGGAS